MSVHFYNIGDLPTNVRKVTAMPKPKKCTECLRKIPPRSRAVTCSKKCAELRADRLSNQTRARATRRRHFAEFADALLTGKSIDLLYGMPPDDVSKGTPGRRKDAKPMDVQERLEAARDRFRRWYWREEQNRREAGARNRKWHEDNAEPRKAQVRRSSKALNKRRKVAVEALNKFMGKHDA
jgi:predicted nucleic acid-binding Zn ribbon protein